jgi:hypothetical protein
LFHNLLTFFFILSGLSSYAHSLAAVPAASGFGPATLEGVGGASPSHPAAPVQIATISMSHLRCIQPFSCKGRKVKRNTSHLVHTIFLVIQLSIASAYFRFHGY